MIHEEPRRQFKQLSKMSGTTGNSTHDWVEVISGTGVEEGADLGQH
jgi:hypothetical protein